LGSPITTLLSYLFLGSTLSLVQAVGILLVVGGVVSVVMVGELGIKDKLFLVRRVKV
jgi:drug/metabolite transporter (DMT)-like permease